MRTLYFIVLLICMLANMRVKAQTCTGSFGEPLDESGDFGSGGNPGPLPAGQTTLTYANNCVNDGFYNIATTSPSCHPGWHNVTEDHTGNKGYMMIINASYDASIFYKKEVSGLCPNTTYRFSVFILNLIKKSFDGPGIKHPKIAFSIEKTDGTVLKSSPSPHTIQPTDNPEWVEDFLEFTTSNEDRIILKMTNMEEGGIGNDLIIDDITFRPCGPLTTAAFSTAAGTTEDICAGENGTYQLVADVADAAYRNYQWQVNTNNAGWQDISPASNGTANAKTLRLNNEFMGALTGKYQYRVGVAKDNTALTACRTYSTPLTINVNALPIVTVAPEKEFCEGQTITVTATGGTRYEWTGPGLPPNSPSLNIPNATPAQSGKYFVTAISDKECYSIPKPVDVTVNPKVTATISAISPICEGGSVQLNASGGTTYKWTPATGLDHDDIANPVATPAVTTTYSVTVSVGACPDVKPVTVTVYKNPKANTPADKEIFEGESVMLDARPGGEDVTYAWSPTTWLDDPFALTPIASPTEDITYTLTVTSPVGCGTDANQVFVRVYKKIIINNTFTPNGDGINDTWQITDLDTYPTCIVSIFNRAGQQVYRSIGYGRPWDGTFNGSALPAGTYYYIIDLKNKTPKRTGFIMLLR